MNQGEDDCILTPNLFCTPNRTCYLLFCTSNPILESALRPLSFAAKIMYIITEYGIPLQILLHLSYSAFVILCICHTLCTWRIRCRILLQLSFKIHFPSYTLIRCHLKHSLDKFQMIAATSLRFYLYDALSWRILDKPAHFPYLTSL